MTFQQLEIGDYFRIPGMSDRCVYRKANSLHCSLNALLQPIRAEIKVTPLTFAEITNYFALKQEFLQSLRR